MSRSLLAICLLCALPAAALQAQERVTPKLEGKWEAHTDDGPRLIMVRSDSSAQFGDQVARWRVVGDSVWGSAAADVACVVRGSL